ncbi:tyrosine-type recombinase/integrase [Streptomyces sp. NPDC058470]|uniref:tyrosine-type recombinase/integrase n=1 Tax=Streptomyces sp. NPDC058470 TaxID=3346515 RepID=UPI00365EA7EC
MPHAEIVPLTVDQVGILANAVQRRYRALVILGAGTGLRPGGLFGLKVKHIDFTHRMVKVEQQIQRVPGEKGVHVCPPKTRRSHRRVPLSGIIATSLRGHLDNFPAHREDFLFRNEKGEPIHSSRFYEQIWRPAIAKAKLPNGTGPHALRHAYASLLIAAEESVKVVAERLGHTNAAMT